MIVVSYRKENVTSTIERLRGALLGRFGVEKIVFGTELLIEPGDDVVEAVETGVEKAKALVVIVTPQWLTGGWAEKKLDTDRIALTKALERKVRIVPLLIDGAVMPDEQELPAAFSSLASRAGVALAEANFDEQFAALVKSLEKNLNTSEPTSATVVTEKNADNVAITAQDAVPSIPLEISVQAIADKVVVGLVTDARERVELYNIPIESKRVPPRTYMPPKTPVRIVGRDRNLQWLNVIYSNTINDNIPGWVKEKDIVLVVNQEGKPIEPMDVSVTNYEFNSRDDIVELINEVKALSGRWLKTLFQIGLLLIVAFLVFAMGISVPDNMLLACRWEDGTVTTFGSYCDNRVVGWWALPLLLIISALVSTSVFPHATRNAVRFAREKRWLDIWEQCRSLLLVWGGLSVSAILTLGYMSPYSLDSGLAPFGLVIIGVILARIIPRLLPAKSAIPDDLVKLESVRRGKQTLAENMKEDAVKAMQMTAALAAGGMAMKMMHETNLAQINSQRNINVTTRRY